jgi:hypothetical protein
MAVILSKAKNPYSASGEILRCAQDDSCIQLLAPSSQLVAAVEAERRSSFSRATPVDRSDSAGAMRC